MRNGAAALGNSVALVAKTVISVAIAAVSGDNDNKKINGITAAVGEHEKWNSKSGATEHMSSNTTAFENCKSVAPGIMVQIADGTFLQVARFGKLVLPLIQQPNGQMTVTLDRVTHMSLGETSSLQDGLPRNLANTP